jgi:hypothetical protein
MGGSGRRFPGLSSLYKGLVVLVTGFMLGGCVATPTYISETDRGPFAPIVLLTLSAQPAVDANIGVKTTGEGGLKGAGRGVGVCAEATASGQELGALLFLICAPFGAVIGGMHGLSISEKEKQLRKTTTTAWQSAFSSARQEVLAEFIENYGHQHGLEFTRQLATLDGKPITEDLHLKPYSDNDRKPVLLTGVKTLSLRRIGRSGKSPSETMVCVRARIFTKLYRRQNTNYKEYNEIVGCKMLSEWVADNGAELKQAIHDAYKRRAENFVYQLFLAYYPAQKDAGNRQATSEPIKVNYPPIPRIKQRDQAPSPEEVEVEVDRRKLLVPVIQGRNLTLDWSAYHPVDAKGRNLSRVDNISYDVLVYRGLITGYSTNTWRIKAHESWWGVGDLVYQRKIITGTSHTIETALDNCGVYFWTIRANFTLNGWPRTTEWSGLYAMGSGDRMRLASKWYYQGFYLLPFRTGKPESEVSGCNPRKEKRLNNSMVLPR